MKVLISRRSWLVKYILLIPVLLMFFSFKTDNEINISREFDELDTKVKILENSTENLFARVRNQKFLEVITTSTSSHSSIPIQLDEKNEEIKLRKLLRRLNNEALIQNENFIKELIQQELNNQKNSSINRIYSAPKFFVILIQIHSRISYLKELIESLSNTRHIRETLVIFSHDVYNEEMNNLIKSITFCATLQIFYPYSIQAYINEFPGKDPKDCGKTMTKEQAIKANCQNAYHYDSYGHYREHNIVQIKHHWFWKLGFVFEKLAVVKEIENLQILLLEEDYYLMPDSIHVLRKLSEKILSDIDVVSLAHIEKLVQNLSFDKLDMYAKAIWHTSHHNTGLMLGRSQWKMIKNCLNAFCAYDDYNWDWTLQYISQTCFKLPLVSIYPSSSRVIHIGECGTHYKGKNCDPQKKVNELKRIYNEKKAQFFGNDLKFEKVDTSIKQIKKSNGGWSDPRDHQLCKSFLYDHFSVTNITILTS